MEISACLPAAPGRCSAHHRVELVVPLLLAVVHEAEKLADAHVVCLRRGAWVSGAASSVRAAPADQCAITKRQTDFFLTSHKMFGKQPSTAALLVGD